MVLDWALLVIGLVGAVYVLANARRLARRPRRGTEWRPSYRAYLLAAVALVLMAAGAALNIVNS